MDGAPLAIPYRASRIEIKSAGTGEFLIAIREEWPLITHESERAPLSVTCPGAKWRIRCALARCACVCCSSDRSKRLEASVLVRISRWSQEENRRGGWLCRQDCVAHCRRSLVFEAWAVTSDLQAQLKSMEVSQELKLQDALLMGPLYLSRLLYDRSNLQEKLDRTFTSRCLCSAKQLIRTFAWGDRSHHLRAVLE